MEIAILILTALSVGYQLITLKNDEISNVYKLRHTWHKITLPNQGQEEFKLQSITVKKAFGINLYNILEAEISNPFLINNKKLYGEWEALMSSAKLFCSSNFRNDKSGKTVEEVTNETLNMFIDEFYSRWFKILKLLKETEVYEPEARFLSKK